MRLSGGISLALGLALAGCREPTEMTFTMSTDVPCSHVTGVALATGTSSDFDSRPIATTGTTCTGAGDLGSIVTVPLHDKGSSMGLKVILGVGRDPVDCDATFGTGCIVARRALNYVPHTRLELQIPLNQACLGVACPADQTCVAGACTSATIADPTQCKAACTELALPAPTTQASVPSAKVCGDMFGLQPGAIWPMQGFCPTRLGRGPRAGAQSNVVKWTAPLGAPLHGGPSIAADGTIFIGGEDGKLYAVSPGGAILWSSRAGGGFGQTTGVIGRDGTIYAGAEDGTFYAFLFGGGVAWSRPLSSGNVWPPPVITGGGTILVGGGTTDPAAFAFDSTGTLKWKLGAGGDVLSAPAIGVDGTIYVGSEDRNLYALGQDGSLKWTFAGAHEIQSAIAAENGNVYFNGKPSICAVDGKGALLWQTATDGEATTPASAGNGTIYAGSANGAFYAFDGATGAITWQVTLAGFDTYLQPIVGADGTIYAGAIDGTFYALSPTGAVKWKLATGSAIHGSAAIGADGTTYFGTEDGKLYAVGP